MNCSAQDFLELSELVLKKGDCFRFRAQGWSMSPFIRNGDLIQVKSVSPLNLKYGDIIFYHNHRERVIVHRIINKDKVNDSLIFLVKGDSSQGKAEYVYQENIVGKVVAIEKRRRTINMENNLVQLANTCYVRCLPFSKLIMRSLQKLHLL